MCNAYLYESKSVILLIRYYSGVAPNPNQSKSNVKRVALKHKCTKYIYCVLESIQNVSNDKMTPSLFSRC